ncbi:MAG: HD domain-containing protein [Methanomassiliicoccaceae archaeon]|nr:HD domain-containing protein [Methanomassiliicoccaceae archaeon]
MVFKIVHDPLHGSIVLDDLFLDLADRHEMQRLRSIKQLGMGNLVFPGANHTRFEHSLGVYHLSGRMALSLGLSKEESEAVRAAGMLHDICHLPYSHTLSEIAEIRFGLDHMEAAGMLINGSLKTYSDRDERLFGSEGPISEMLDAAGISSRKVCDLIAYPESPSVGLDAFSQDSGQSYFRSGDYLHQIIHGPVDSDQMDYLVRDAHYTGVTHGAIDTERIISMMQVFNDRIVLNKGGTTAAEGLMVSRSLMYTSVYYHETVRIAGAMLNKAVEASDLDLSEMYLMTDADLISLLEAHGGRPMRIVRDLMNRRLYKKAAVGYVADLSEDQSYSLAQYTGYYERKKLEQEIADMAGADVSEVSVDIPSESALLSKISIGKTDVSILDGGRVRSITKLSTIAKALQSRDTFRWAILVSAPKDKRDAVEAAAKKIIGT